MVGVKDKIAAGLSAAFGVKVHAFLIVLLLLLLAALWGWPSYEALAGVVLAALLAVWIALRVGKSDDRHSIEGLAALLTCIALLLAGYWYFIERKGIPKLNVDTTVDAWPISNGALFVRIETKFENVGTVKYEIEEEDPFRLEIGQVYPVRPADDVRELKRAFDARETNEFGAYNIKRNDNWPLLAIINGEVSTEIEAGETEKRYFKAIIECRENMVIAATTVVPKRIDWLNGFFERRKEPLFWKSQTLSDPIKNCRQ